MLKKFAATSRQLFLMGIFAICFLLPFEPRFLATIEIATVLFFFLGHSPISIISNLRKSNITLLYFGYFAWVVISYFISADQLEANRQLHVKLPFLIIPLLLVGSGMSKANAKKSIIFFIAGCASACIVLLAWATYDYWQTGDSLVFMYAPFSRFMHVTYFGIYLLFCFGWLFMVALEDKVLYPKSHYFLMVLYAICLVLLSAKIMLLAFVLSAFLFGAYFAWRKKKIWTAALIMVVISSLPFILYAASAYVRLRVDSVLEEVNHRNEPVNPVWAGSTTTRIAIWKDAWRDILEVQPMGTGVGDVKNMLLEKYHQRGFTAAIDKHLNMHNEYLQALAGMGILGFILFILITLAPAIFCAFPHQFGGIIFSFSILMASLTESILERQAGTIFICLVGVLLIITYKKAPAEITNS